MLYLYQYLKTLSATFTLLIIISSISFEATSQPIRYDSLRDFNQRSIKSFFFNQDSELVIAGYGTNGSRGFYFGIYDTTHHGYTLRADTFYVHDYCNATNSIEDIIIHPESGYLAAVNIKECGVYQFGLLWLDNNAQEKKYSAVPGYEPYSWDYGRKPTFQDIFIRDDGHVIGMVSRMTSAPSTEHHKVISFIEFDENLDFVDVYHLENTFNKHRLEAKYIQNKLFVYGHYNADNTPDYRPSLPCLAELDPYDFSIKQNKDFGYPGFVEDLNIRNNELLVSWAFSEGYGTGTNRLSKVDINDINRTIDSLDYPASLDAILSIRKTAIINDDYAISFMKLDKSNSSDGIGNYIFLFNYSNFSKIDSLEIQADLESDIADIYLDTEGLYYVFSRPGDGLFEYWTELGVVRTQDIVSTQDLSSLRNQFVNIYPNPVQEGNTITLNHALKLPSVTNIEVYDLEGRLLHSSILPLNSQSTKFRVDYPSGVYIIQLQSGSRIHATKKLIVY